MMKRLVSAIIMLAGILCSISPVYAENPFKHTENFIILFDTSGSMGQIYKNTGKTKALIAKEILREMTHGIEGNYKAGLYTFTPFEEYYRFGEYNRELFSKAIERLPEKFFAGGMFGHPTPIGKGLHKADAILSKATGRTAVYLFSDGRNTDDTDPVEEAKQLHERHDVCFYIISMAQSKDDMKLLEDILAINECSHLVDFGYARENPDVNLIPIGRNVIIQFELNKDANDSEFQSKLKELGKYLKANPDSKVLISGHTCNIGTDKYNIELSKRRAEKTKDYLSKSFGVNPKRMTLRWYGNSAPLAGNDTEEGRQKNRRVEIKLMEN